MAANSEQILKQALVEQLLATFQSPPIRILTSCGLAKGKTGWTRMIAVNSRQLQRKKFLREFQITSVRVAVSEPEAVATGSS